MTTKQLKNHVNSGNYQILSSTKNSVSYTVRYENSDKETKIIRVLPLINRNDGLCARNADFK
jgi:hypothetical protein